MEEESYHELLTTKRQLVSYNILGAGTSDLSDGSQTTKSCHPDIQPLPLEVLLFFKLWFLDLYH